MKTYLLFVYAYFKNHEDVESFSLDILGSSPKIKKIRFVIESDSKNFIVIFESDSGRKELSEELNSIIPMTDIKFYFLFDRDTLYTANLPIQLKDFMFKPSDEYTYLKLEYELKETNNSNSEMDFNEILDKITEHGVESLTPEEKNFLDNFEK